MISKRIYFTILMLFISAFAMFMFVGISSGNLAKSRGNQKATEKSDVQYQNTLTSASLNLAVDDSEPWSKDTKTVYQDQKLSVAIVATDQEDAITGLLIEWCVYHKYFYEVYTSLPQNEEIAGYGLILFGDIRLTSEDVEILYNYADLGKTMIFTKPPDYAEIRGNQMLSAFLGIEITVEQEVEVDGIRIFPKFMIGGERIYQKGDHYGDQDDTVIRVPYYKLSPGYEIYAVGLFENQKELGIEDKELPPLLWRTKTKESFIFVVNSDIFHGMSLPGVLTGFMTQEKECYLYPIVNAQTISLIGYPYLSNENEQAIKRLYSRSSEALSRDLLWPNIIQVLKNYGVSYNFFAASQLDYIDKIGPSDNNLDFYLREINKLPGEMGLSLGQVSGIGLDELIDKNNLFFKEHLPDYKFSTLYLAEFNAKEIKENLDHELLDKISLIMSDYKQGDMLLDFINNNVLSVKFNLDGYQHETLDDLRMSFVENALGMCNMKVDIARVIFPQDSNDEWNNLSLKWSRGDTYFKDYSVFDMVSQQELEKRVRRFYALDFVYEYNKNGIDLQIKNFDEEAYFILSIYDKSIVSMTGGEAVKISADTYLVKAKASAVKIQLREDNVLEKPNNNRIISSNPLTRLTEEDSQ